MAMNYANNPADTKFDGGYIHNGTFLFDDGSIGTMGDPEFDITEEYEDEDWDNYDPDETDEVPPHLYLNGRAPIGNIYIDRYTGFGSDGFEQGGCFWYYEGETYRDWCERNGEPIPVKEIPYEIYEAFENEDLDTIKTYCKEFPELYALIEDRPVSKPKTKQSRKSDVPILKPKFVPIKPMSEDDYWFDDLIICPNCGSDWSHRLGDTKTRICDQCGCAYVNTYSEEPYIDYPNWDHSKFDEYRATIEKERNSWFKKGSDYKVFDGTAYSPENFDRMRYGGLFNYENPKDRSRILNFNFRKKR